MNLLIRPASHVAFLLLATVSLPLLDVNAQVTPATCQSDLVQAEDQIANGFFDEAIALLEPCRTLEDVDTNQQARTFKLLADAYLAKRYVSEARDAIAKLLDLAPNFTPDINLDSQTFRDLLAELRSERIQPAAPEGFTASVENGQIILAWSPIDSETVARLLLHRGDSEGALAPLDSISAGATGYTDSDVVAGQTYFYALQSISPNGIPSSFTDTQSASIATVTPPAEDIDAMPPSIASDTKTSKSGWQKWALIGGGVAAGGVVAVILGGGGGGGGPDDVDNPLPGPPSIP